MANPAPRRPDSPRHPQHIPVDFHVNEVASDMAGSLSPYGPDTVFPIPVEKLPYKHPTAADRPHLADGR